MKTEKFTVIYLDSWMSGSNRHAITRMARINVPIDRVPDIMKWIEEQGEIDPNSCVYLFEGHSKMVGE